MAIDVPIKTKSGKLPMNIEFVPDDYQGLLMQRLNVYLSGDGVLLGSVGPTVPDRNVGAWWDGSGWWVWSDEFAAYVPVKLGFLSADKLSGITLKAAPTENRTINFPDDSGEVALIEDVYTPRDATVLTGTNPTLNASLSSDFYLVLEGDTTIAGIHLMPAGGEIRVTIINDGTSYTVTWPNSGANNIGWPGGTEPVQPVANETGIASATYIIRNVDLGITTHYWGEYALDFRLDSGDTIITPTPIRDPAPGDGGPYDLP